MPRNRDIGVTGEPTRYEWGPFFVEHIDWNKREHMGTFPDTPTTRGKYAKLENHGRPPTVECL